jgi:hypothetical protein
MSYTWLVDKRYRTRQNNLSNIQQHNQKSTDKKVETQNGGDTYIILKMHICYANIYCLKSTLVSFTNKTDRHDITEILLNVALNTIKQTTQPTSVKKSGQNKTVNTKIMIDNF